ncbi:MAG: hypothetical protein HRU20_07955 [Pseudomonadales bacterium]|nr:hypothetical protein [Pseudomonadales bacterium]
MKKLLASSVAAAAISTGFALPAQAEIEGLSANVGAVSDYYFRGVSLGDAGAYAGLDYEVAGFYIGTWMIDDGGTGSVGGGNDGLEYDMYLGWGMESEAGFGFNVGYSRFDYTYTSDFEHELNLGLSMSGFGLDVALGQDDDSESSTSTGEAEALDYLFVGLSWSGDVYGATLGHFEYDTATKGHSASDSEWNYVEFSAGGEVATLDMSVSVGRNFGIKNGGASVGSSGTEYIVLDVSKSFSF